MIKACQSFLGYSASENGDIFSNRRRIKLNGRHGGTRAIIDHNYFKKLKPINGSKGYFNVSININGKIRPVGIHRLVLDAFSGPCPYGYQTRHLDGNPQNNHISNLKWGTALDNARDRLIHGKYYFGEQHHNFKHGKYSIKKTEES